MKAKNNMVLDILSLPDNLSFARVTVAAFASQLDFTINDLEELKVVVSEAVGNAIIHGYDGSGGKRIRIGVTLYPGAAEIVVEDTGRGIEDIEQAMVPAYSTDPERMGLGFTFMKSFTEDLRVESNPGLGTRITMVKKPSLVMHSKVAQ